MTEPVRWTGSFVCRLLTLRLNGGLLQLVKNRDLVLRSGLDRTAVKMKPGDSSAVSGY